MCQMCQIINPQSVVASHILLGDRSRGERENNAEGVFAGKSSHSLKNAIQLALGGVIIWWQAKIN